MLTPHQLSSQQTIVDAWLEHFLVNPAICAIVVRQAVA